MRRLFLTLSLTAVAAFGVQAQTAVVDDYKKGEGYVGYSNGQVDTGLDSGSSVRDFFRDRASFNGFNVQGTYNFNRFLGVKGDISGTYNGTTFSESIVNPNNGVTTTVSFDTTNSLYNFVGGVQVKDNNKSGSFKPFAHAMVGLAHVRTKINDVVCTPATLCPVTEDSFSDNGLSGVFGGGIDFRLTDRFHIRAIQLDYNPIRANGDTSHNLRIGAGIVF
jgi:opacity protein-like surface antigen